MAFKKTKCINNDIEGNVLVSFLYFSIEEKNVDIKSGEIRFLE
jgi:hypothetical protein